MAQYSFKYAVGEEVKIYEGHGLYDLTSFEVDPKYLKSALVVGISIYMDRYEYRVLRFDNNTLTTVEEKYLFPAYEIKPCSYEYVEEIDDENEPSLEDIQQSL